MLPPTPKGRPVTEIVFDMKIGGSRLICLASPPSVAVPVFGDVVETSAIEGNGWTGTYQKRSRHGRRTEEVHAWRIPTPHAVYEFSAQTDMTRPQDVLTALVAVVRSFTLGQDAL